MPDDHIKAAKAELYRHLGGAYMCMWHDFCLTCCITRLQLRTVSIPSRRPVHVIRPF